MRSLTEAQARLLDCCVRQISRVIGNGGGALLLTGRPGRGKRFLARATADFLEYEFLEIPLHGPEFGLRCRLFGTENECRRAMENGRAPGDLSTDAPSVVYLSDFGCLPEGLHQVFHRLLTRRSYQDALGNEWRLPRDLILVVALTEGVGESIAGEHWLRQYFDAEISISAPEGSEELLRVIVGMLAELDPTKVSTITPEEALSIVVAADGNLRQVRKWLQTSVMIAPSADILCAADVFRTVNEDAGHLIGQICYCSSNGTSARFAAWAEQFPEDLRSVPLRILRFIRDEYFISAATVQRAVETLMQRSGISPGRRVTFCRWQHLGKSAEALAREFKNRGMWKVCPDLSLCDDIASWPPQEKMRGIPIIVADDMAGSGETLGSLFADNARSLKHAAQYYADSAIHVLLVTAYEDAVRQVADMIKAENLRIRIDVYRVLRSRDKCFSEDSQIFPTEEERKRMEGFCHTVAMKHFPKMPVQHRLGYRGVGSLCVFYNTVPNNTLPLIWYDNAACEWKPLFPARGLTVDVSE